MIVALLSQRFNSKPGGKPPARPSRNSCPSSLKINQDIIIRWARYLAMRLLNSTIRPIATLPSFYLLLILAVIWSRRKVRCNSCAQRTDSIIPSKVCLWLSISCSNSHTTYMGKNSLILRRIRRNMHHNWTQLLTSWLIWRIRPPWSISPSKTS